jgi:hypothetical protein
MLYFEKLQIGNRHIAFFVGAIIVSGQFYDITGVLRAIVHVSKHLY